LGAVVVAVDGVVLDPPELLELPELPLPVAVDGRLASDVAGWLLKLSSMTSPVTVLRRVRMTRRMTGSGWAG
jgi:hypothetical protein